MLTKNDLKTEFTYLNTDDSKILFEDVSYCKYRGANLKSDVTWRCPQCKFVTLKTIDCNFTFLILLHYVIKLKNSNKTYLFSL